MNDTFVRALITKHEGFRGTVYSDSRGKATIGIGFNLSDPTAPATCAAHGLNYQALLNGAPISFSDAQAVMSDQILSATFSATKLIPNFNSLPDDAQAVVVDMLFNMGQPVFAEFHATIAALKAGNCQLASIQIKNSNWYGEVGARGLEDVSLMESAA